MTAAASGCATTQVAVRPQPFPGSVAADAGIPTARPRTLASAVVDAALALRGASYRLGGDRPSQGFDCSGLVRYVFEQEHVDVPRTVADQFRAGRKVSNNRVKAGDLVFFSTTAKGATHVGIAIDRERFVHAPGTGGVVRIEPIGTPYWSRRLVGVRRITAH